MAFNIFKKKEEVYPSEEKEEVLGEAPQDLENINLEEKPEEGFRSPSEMMPPPIKPLETRVNFVPPTQIPPSAPNIPTPQMTPSEQVTPRPGVFGEISEKAQTKTQPRIFIKINKYKEVMATVQNLHNIIAETKKDLENLHDMGKKEEDKLKEAAEVVLRMEELLKYLEETFTSPEEN